MQLANLAWRNEVAHEFLGAKEFEALNQGEDWLQQLATIRLLPPNFADRPDQSQPTIDGERWVDSRRGLRGYFLPIPDTPVTSATPGEIEDYESLAAFHAEKWQEFDPLVVAMQRARDKESDELEQLTVDAELITLGQGKYGRFAKMLGEPSSMEFACDVPQLVSAQLSLKDRISLDANRRQQWQRESRLVGCLGSGGFHPIESRRFARCTGIVEIGSGLPDGDR